MKWLMIYPEDGPSKPVYLAWLKTFGLEADVISPGESAPAPADRYGGLFLTGGGDIQPGAYGREQHPATNDVDPRRDDLEKNLIREYIDAGKPIFGICRGQQILNVAFGGKLIQHVPDVVGDREIHTKKGTYDSMHPIVFEGGTRVAHALDGVKDVNSSHHQAIDPDFVGKGLRVAARSGAGVIEAVECFEHAAPIIAVQWHPERMDRKHPASHKMFEELLRSSTSSV